MNRPLPSRVPFRAAAITFMGGALLATGCAAVPPPQVDAPAPDGPIWPAPERPAALPLLQLTPGEESLVSLAGYDLTASRVKVEAPEGLLAGFVPPGRLRLQADPSVSQTLLAIATVTWLAENGEPEQIAIPVRVEALPIRSFAYDPGSREVESVALAGSFNGWSSTADMMTRGEDGVFRIDMPIGPGTWTYKLVVDGEWMADPANPEQDGSGFGNSVLRIEGEAIQEFSWSLLPGGAPASEGMPAFHATLPNDDALDPETVTIIANNHLVPREGWQVIDDRILRLSAEPRHWGGDNTVTLLARSQKGRIGTRVFPVVYTNAPRSPHDEVIYFTFTDRFHDGDATNNPPNDDDRIVPLAHYHGGDWAGIRQKIDSGYFTELGVTTLWISPPNKNTPNVEQESVEPFGHYTSYHGYWPISATETNPPYGTMDELQGLVDAAHRNGIAVLLDFVANHVHEDHPLLQYFPDLATEYELPNGEKNLRLFDAHPFTTWFDDFLPSIDYAGNPEVIDLMVENAVYWLRESGADGFRHDAVKHIPLDFWTTLTATLREEFEEKEGRFVYQVGETISGYDTVSKFVGPELLTGQFDFPGYFGARDVLARGRGSMADLARGYADAERWYSPAAIMSPLIGNHDVSRFMAFADGDLPDGMEEKEVGRENPPQVDSPESFLKLRLAFAWLLTSPGGPPTLYYGDEIGMTGAGDPDNRRPMIWGELTEDQLHTRGTLAALNRLRLDSVALRRGSLRVHLTGEERVLFSRTTPEQTVLVLLSRRPATDWISLNLPEEWGLPAEVRPLLAERVASTYEDGRLRIEDQPFSFGVWEVDYGESRLNIE